MTVKKKMMVVVVMMMRAKINFKKALVFEKVSRTKKDTGPGSQKVHGKYFITLSFLE